jgi:transposase InsO family protein
MRAELEQLKQLVAELSLKNRVLKKACWGRSRRGTNDAALPSREAGDHRPGRALNPAGWTQPGRAGGAAQPAPDRRTGQLLPVVPPVPARRGAGAGAAAVEASPVLPVLADQARGIGCPNRCATRLSGWHWQSPRSPLDSWPGCLPWRVRPGFTDREGYIVSESSVFRLLKRFDLVESPAFELVTAADRFAQPTHRVNDLWQTGFTTSRSRAGVGTLHCPRAGYLSIALDDCSGYILAWTLTPTMAATDVQETLEWH